MTEKKNVPAGGGTPTGTGTEKAAGQAVISCSHCTTPHPQRQVVSEWLGVGAKNGKTMKELLLILNGDNRTIRAQIERERRTTPILSGPTGYFLPDCEDEVRQFCGSMRRRARAVWRSAANVERAAGLGNQSGQLEGQLSIEEGGNT